MAHQAIDVPLAVDAHPKIVLGGFSLPLRSLLVLVPAVALSAFALMINSLSLQWRLAIGILLMSGAWILATPMREGIWIVTYALYRATAGLLPSVVKNGTSYRDRVTVTGNALRYDLTKTAITTGRLAALVPHLIVPRAKIVAPGLVELSGRFGMHAVLQIDGPPVSLASDQYVSWCERLINWLQAVECPAQILTIVTHHDAQRAEAAVDQRLDREWRTKFLGPKERRLAGEVAARSLGMTHFAVLSPDSATTDGIPFLSRLRRASAYRAVSQDAAERVLEQALRLAAGLAVRVPDHEDLSNLLSDSLVGADSAATSGDVLTIREQHFVPLTMTKLPSRLDAGQVVDALMQARTRGVASLHIIPMADGPALKTLDRQRSLFKWSNRTSGGDDRESAQAINQIDALEEAILNRRIRPCRVALTLAIVDRNRDEALAGAERVQARLQGRGFRTTRLSGPGFLPALALSPGGPPLARSLHLTANVVALRLLPTLGTPFADHRQPFIGFNVLTGGTPAYLDVWSRPNHNAVIVGSTGAGKSVATKTMLLRHVMSGASCVVIDPDSEYRNVLEAIGGRYYELGEDSLNVLATGLNVPPDIAASLIGPILSVMAGDEKGIRDGRPIRRLPDEDQGWIHTQIADFYRAWAERCPGREPVMHNLVEYLEKVSCQTAPTERERERGRVISQRLVRFTQGKRGQVFDRPSTFEVGRQPVGIGLKTFTMSYGSDLTPALAVILTSILAAIDRREGRMIVVVDEAHRVTCDPDAGEVLGQLVRQARKYGAGVWMASQKVEDFVNTDLGKTLAATASTKLVLGTEDAVVDAVAEVFHLNEEEVSAICPLRKGQGVLISGDERTVVQVYPGAALMPLVATTPDFVSAHQRTPVR